MTRYSLYYWPIPFRGHFVRYVLSFAGATYDQPDVKALVALKSAPVADQPLPLMAPPVLRDHAVNLWLSQLPAILMYLGRQHDLLPGEAAGDALTLKVICDCNDVLEEITCNCGARMWTPETWRAFAADRLPRWMAIFEETGRRHGLGAADGHLLGTSRPMLADLATAALWHTMADKLRPLGRLLENHAPTVAALSGRVAALPAIAAMRQAQDKQHGDAWCGGEIEASLRTALGC